MGARPSYLFGPFRLSADGTMLSRDGLPIPLAPKPLRTLLTLVQHAGEVITKTQLVEAVWPDSFVEDTGLTRNISVIRQALGKDGARLIATVPRLGYRFTAPVGWVDDAIASPALRSSDVNRSKRHVRMVGRTSELSALQRTFDSVAVGPGRIVAVTGEPGIGKTTIVDSFLYAIDERSRVGRGKCSQRLAGAEPHLPILEALEELTTNDPAVTQILVKRTLAATPDARPPDTLVEKIASRLDRESASAQLGDRRVRPPQKKTASRLV